MANRGLIRLNTLMSTVIETLSRLGYALPEAPAPAANYVSYTISGNTLYIAGQIPVRDGVRQTGRLGDDYTLEEGQEAARLCALAILGQVNAALSGDWDRVVRCLKLGGFVNSTPDFDQHPAVINGASDLIVAALGERGKHARFAVGAPSLPFGVAVEIDAMFEIA